MKEKKSTVIFADQSPGLASVCCHVKSAPFFFFDILPKADDTPAISNHKQRVQGQMQCSTPGCLRQWRLALARRQTSKVGYH